MQHLKAVLQTSIVITVILTAAGCSLFRSDAVDDMIIGSAPSNPSAIDYYNVYEPYNDAASGLKGTWYMHNSSGGWDLILYENGFYSLQKLVGYGMDDSEVGTFKLKNNILYLSSNGQLDETRRRQWAPRKLIVMQNETNTILVPKRYETQFRKYGSSRYVCFNRRAIGETVDFVPED
ncbi:hypothetical protein KS4_09910 [Poriferisphaera corsica]|uniref:Lipoprotein n=1 Tax=Poriferisphaera corsica TaxID=2528020 RepID=A0A517YRU8_9BACT|nr:hypothetical protein [Poriferisphaera corsica]QDU32952.1 hypothetical protein KS4_09910 [Poriferisphaera corsica]